MKTEEITLGAGCFWCIEAFFNEVSGVISATSGYCNGHVPGKPTYREVCSGLTGFAEVVKIKFNADIINLKEILMMFFSAHNPTTLNKQGADTGTQYRSGIFYHNNNQKDISKLVINEVQQYFNDPIVTEVTAVKRYFDAENYHQGYYKQNLEQGYCMMVIAPKLKKLRSLYIDKIK